MKYKVLLFLLFLMLLKPDISLANNGFDKIIEVTDKDNQVKGLVTEAGSIVTVRLGDTILGSASTFVKNVKDNFFLVPIQPQPAGTTIQLTSSRYGTSLNNDSTEVIIKAAPEFKVPPEVEWEYSEKGFYDIQPTNDGNYLVSGVYESGGSKKSYILKILKIDSLGTKYWERLTNITQSTDEWFYTNVSIYATIDGGYIVAYTFKGSEYIKLKKYDKFNKTLWEKNYYISQTNLKVEIRSVIQTKDGGYVIIGTNIDTKLDTRNIYLLKIDDSGNKEWEKFDLGAREGNSIQQTSDEGYIIASSIGIIIKIDSQGNKKWEKAFGGLGISDFNSIKKTNEGGYIVVGNTSYGRKYIYVVNIDMQGNLKWEKFIGKDNRNNFGYAVQQTNDSGYVISGNTYVSNAWGLHTASLFVKLNNEGYQEWEIIYDDYNKGHSVQQTNGGGYIIATNIKLLKLGNALIPPSSDLNNDGKLNIIDIQILANKYGQFSGGNYFYYDYDLNNDGKIDIFDLVILSRSIR